jgi:hypothetical protein
VLNLDEFAKCIAWEEEKAVQQAGEGKDYHLLTLNLLEVKCDDDRYAAIIRRKAGEVPVGNRFGTG